MIAVSALTKTFGARRAVDGVSMQCPAGTVTAVLGLNGAGKTTLLRMIAGLESPDSGTVTGPRLGVHLGPDAANPRHTVRRHLRWLAALRGLPADNVEATLVEAGLHDRRADRVGGLSLGARQRLAIASALLGDPAALLFDEPLNGLDVPGIVWFRTLLRDQAARGRAILVATHLLGEVALSADRVLILHDGRLQAAGPLADVVPPGVDRRAWLESTLLECA